MAIPCSNQSGRRLRSCCQPTVSTSVVTNTLKKTAKQTLPGSFSFEKFRYKKGMPLKRKTAADCRSIGSLLKEMLRFCAMQSSHFWLGAQFADCNSALRALVKSPRDTASYFTRNSRAAH